MATWFARNPERARALSAVNNALRAGRIVKSPCIECGSTDRLRCHHADYSKKLDVTWHCLRCHQARVNAERAAAPKVARQCDVVDCNSPHFCKGYCRKHFERWKKYGDPSFVKIVMSPRGSVKRWLQDHATHDGDECLVWPFSRHPDGRAQMGSAKPSRLICEMAHGPAPTKRHEAAHSCGNAYGGCVNPKHLRWATPVENAADKRIHGTVVEGEAHFYAKLTEADVRRIRQMAQTVPQKDLCPIFGVNANTISKVVSRKSWKHVQ